MKLNAFKFEVFVKPESFKALRFSKMLAQGEEMNS